MGQLILHALTGPVKGKSFKIRNGLRIGRTSGDICLKDSLVSNLHAEIQIYSSGKVMIVDKGSKNKIYINNKRVVKSILEEGSKFNIGSTKFELKIINSPEELWSEFLTLSVKKIKDNPLNLKVFSKLVEISFKNGIQKGQIYQLSYGPRFFGRQSVDCPIFDKKSPAKCFTLVPEDKDIIFITKHPDTVQLNKESIRKAVIKNGDQILIGDSLLEIRLK
ncbi:MAG: FHA domain-containing protein [Bdellovibrionaceae bacterium]|nr:FHA domain-containing protein [Pseudobdellovibrionaceae bacterium]